MKVDFYILDIESKQRSHLFACQLLEKAYREEKRVYVKVNSKEEAERFDALLWTYREDSFIPHQLYQAEDPSPPLIQIGFDSAAPHSQQDLLINLCSDFSSFFQQFPQVIEIVFSDPTVQQLARERYKQYRDLGSDIQTHKLKANEI